MASTQGNTTIDAAEIQEQSARRLRAVLGRLGRLLRPTETGTATNLTPTRISVLLTADRRGPVRLSDIAEREGLNPTLLSRTVAHLVDVGLLERSADPEDRRSAWVSVTDQGHVVAEGVLHDRMLAVYGALAQLDRQDQEQIDAALPALERLAEVLRAQSPEARNEDGSR